MGSQYTVSYAHLATFVPMFVPITILVLWFAYFSPDVHSLFNIGCVRCLFFFKTTISYICTVVHPPFVTLLCVINVLILVVLSVYICHQLWKRKSLVIKNPNTAMEIKLTINCLAICLVTFTYVGALAVYAVSPKPGQRLRDNHLLINRWNSICFQYCSPFRFINWFIRLVFRVRHSGMGKCLHIACYK